MPPFLEREAWLGPKSVPHRSRAAPLHPPQHVRLRSSAIGQHARRTTTTGRRGT
jgi:hypothetical protein